jgi:hypothetical protein
MGFRAGLARMAMAAEKAAREGRSVAKVASEWYTSSYWDNQNSVRGSGSLETYPIGVMHLSGDANRAL